jgi:hypothetical protein
MQMFCDATITLGQSQICETLWPKKPTPQKTLYALIAVSAHHRDRMR